MDGPSPAPEALTTLDWLGLVAAACTVLVLAVFPVVGRTFAGMYADLGGDEALPWLTRLATSAWFPPCLALPVVAGIVAGSRREVELATRRVAIVGAFVLGVVGFGLCLVGVYLPVFALAGAVK